MYGFLSYHCSCRIPGYMCSVTAGRAPGTWTTGSCGECLAGFGPACPIRCSMASLGAQVPGTGLEPVERVRATRHCHCIQSTRTKRNAPNIKVQDQITVPGLSRVPEWYRS